MNKEDMITSLRYLQLMFAIVMNLTTTFIFTCIILSYKFNGYEICPIVFCISCFYTIGLLKLLSWYYCKYIDYIRNGNDELYADIYKNLSYVCWLIYWINFIISIVMFVELDNEPFFVNFVIYSICNMIINFAIVLR